MPQTSGYLLHRLAALLVSGRDGWVAISIAALAIPAALAVACSVPWPPRGKAEDPGIPVIILCSAGGAFGVLFWALARVFVDTRLGVLSATNRFAVGVFAVWGLMGPLFFPFSLVGLLVAPIPAFLYLLAFLVARRREARIEAEASAWHSLGTASLLTGALYVAWAICWTVGYLGALSYTHFGD